MFVDTKAVDLAAAVSARQITKTRLGTARESSRQKFLAQGGPLEESRNPIAR
jgi:hypothetical protein